MKTKPIRIPVDLLEAIGSIAQHRGSKTAPTVEALLRRAVKYEEDPHARPVMLPVAFMPEAVEELTSAESHQEFLLMYRGFAGHPLVTFATEIKVGVTTVNMKTKDGSYQTLARASLICWEKLERPSQNDVDRVRLYSPYRQTGAFLALSAGVPHDTRLVNNIPYPPS